MPANNAKDAKTANMGLGVLGSLDALTPRGRPTTLLLCPPASPSPAAAA